MSAQRGASGLSGILLIDKPRGITSHDVVNRVRRMTGEKRVGHAGTLDPDASGLLVVCVGPATRLTPYLTAATKSYRATITFGAATDTDDADGAVIAVADIPAAIADDRFAIELLGGFVGKSEQVPPAYSAIKVDGQVSHRVARSGGELELAPRPIEVLKAHLVRIDCEHHAWTVDFTVSKGTYIRSLARDIGVAAGTLGHLTALRRVACGALRVEDAAPIDLADPVQTEPDLIEFIDPLPALGFPVVNLTDDGENAVADGRALDRTLAEGYVDGTLLSLAREGRLLAVYAVEGDRLVARTVIPGGVSTVVARF